MIYCVKQYESLSGPFVFIEFIVHYKIWIFVRATPVREMGGRVSDIKNGKRCWITTGGMGWMRLEDV